MSNSLPASGMRIQSLDRGLRILDLVGQAPEGLTLSDLARALDLGKTTVHNLARTLVLNGHLASRRAPIRYVLGPALFRLIARQRRHALLERAAPTLLALARDFPGSAALLAEEAQGSVRVTLRVAPERPGIVERPLDRFSPPYANASSLLFLAYWNEEERHAFLLRHPLWETAGHLWPDQEKLEAALDQIRAQGYASLPSPRSHSTPFAFPLFSPSGELLAALGLAYHTTRKLSATSHRQIVARLRAAANTLSSLT